MVLRGEGAVFYIYVRGGGRGDAWTEAKPKADSFLLLIWPLPLRDLMSSYTSYVSFQTQLQ